MVLSKQSSKSFENVLFGLVALFCTVYQQNKALWADGHRSLYSENAEISNIEWAVMYYSYISTLVNSTRDQKTNCYIHSPQQLIHFTNGLMEVNDQLVEKLNSIPKDVVVISIAGPTRTGKSYLLNALVDEGKGFAIGSTNRAETMGVWVLLKDHPHQKDTVIVYLDTEGLYHTDRANTTHDMMTFALALFSSTFIYNIMGNIEDTDLKNLEVVVELLQYSSPGKDKSENITPPSLNVVVRDAFLQLVDDNGTPVDNDGYLQNLLQVKESDSKEQAEIKKTIQDYFPTRSLHTFDRPVNDVNILRNMEKAKRSDINPKFLEQVQRLKTSILKNTKKMAIGKINVKLSVWVNMVKELVKKMNDKDLKEILGIPSKVKENANTIAMQAALKSLDGVKSNFQLPISKEDLNHLTRNARTEAKKIFETKYFGDKEAIDVFQNQFEEWRQEIEKENQEKENQKQQQIQLNIQNAMRKCTELKSQLDLPISEEAMTDFRTKACMAAKLVVEKNFVGDEKVMTKLQKEFDDWMKEIKKENREKEHLRQLQIAADIQTAITECNKLKSLHTFPISEQALNNLKNEARNQAIQTIGKKYPNNWEAKHKFQEVFDDWMQLTVKENNEKESQRQDKITIDVQAVINGCNRMKSDLDLPISSEEMDDFRKKAWNWAQQAIKKKYGLEKKVIDKLAVEFVNGMQDLEKENKQLKDKEEYERERQWRQWERKRAEAELQRERERLAKEKAKKRFGAFIGGAGGIAGFMLGGPWGAAAGSTLGSIIGNAAGEEISDNYSPTWSKKQR